MFILKSVILKNFTYFHERLLKNINLWCWKSKHKIIGKIRHDVYSSPVTCNSHRHLKVRVIVNVTYLCCIKYIYGYMYSPYLYAHTRMYIYIAKEKPSNVNSYRDNMNSAFYFILMKIMSNLSRQICSSVACIVFIIITMCFPKALSYTVNS